MDPEHLQPISEQLLALALAQRQDYAGALVHLRNCLAYMPAGANFDLVKQQISELEAALKPAR